MEPFKHHCGIIAVVDTANVDTDQIIAKQFLKSIQRTGFGEHLFHDWRYLPDGTPDSKFSLNRPEFKGASLLVARNNFGCGSSREHAVWAVQQYGFKAVIAPRKKSGDSTIPAFADIFRNNCGKNGLLTVELSEAEVQTIFDEVSRHPGIKATIDLEKETFTLHTPKEIVFSFTIDPSLKNRLLNGLDDIGITLKEEKAIQAFEKRHTTYLARN